MRKAEEDNFGLSFLDAITCGFGAVILLFVLTASNDQSLRNKETADIRGEVDIFDEELVEGRENLANLRNTLLETEEQIVTAQGLADEVIRETQNLKEEISRLDDETLAKLEHLNQLKADIEAKKKALMAQMGTTRVDPGMDMLRRQGNNRQQYLTGLRTDGRRLVIFVDRSLSMTGETLPEIMAMKAANPVERQGSEKWLRVMEATEWLLATMVETEFFQLFTFSETTEPVLTGQGNDWLATSPETVEAVLNKLGQVVPGGGTNLERAFRRIESFSPKPDNVIVITDGLPTQGDSVALPSGQVSGEDRLRALEMAERAIPSGVPVNVILFYPKGTPRRPVVIGTWHYDMMGLSFLLLKAGPDLNETQKKRRFCHLQLVLSGLYKLWFWSHNPALCHLSWFASPDT